MSGEFLSYYLGSSRSCCKNGAGQRETKYGRGEGWNAKNEKEEEKTGGKGKKSRGIVYPHFLELDVIGCF